MELLLASPTLLLPFSFLLLHLLLKLFTAERTKPCRLPPGPRQLPIIGSIHHLVGELPHRRLRRLAQRFGPLLHLKLGEVDYVVVSSSEVAREILKTHDVAFASRPALAAIKTVAYDCSGMGFSPYGAYWRQLRRICSVEVLSSKRVRSFASIRHEEGCKLLTRLREAAAGSTSAAVNLTEVFLGLTNNHLTRAAFGKECGSRERFLRAMKETIELAPVLSLVDLYPSLAFLISRLDGSTRKMKRLHHEMDAILNEIITEHQEKKGGIREGEEDLVDVLLRIREKGELEIPLQMVHIKAVILDMLVAATETTSSTLDWVMSELIRHPDAMRRIQTEIRGALLRGKETIEEKEIEDHLPYLKLVIKETLRLHPPLPLLLPRTCSERVELFGFTVPARSRVMVNAWAIGRDPKAWEDPECFRPDRFQGSDVDFRGSGGFDYIPFGGGRRICPGMTFALAGLELFLALLLFHFDWHLPEGRSIDMDEVFDGSLRRKNHLCLLATPYVPSEKYLENNLLM